MSDTVTVIQTVGFPIACVIALAFYVYMSNIQTREENAKREERLYKIIDEQSEQMAGLKTSIDNLNETLKTRGY